MTVEINRYSGFQDSAFIDSVNPFFNEQGVETDKDFEVIFNITPNMASIISDNFRLEKSDDAERFPFNEINYTIDWFPLQKKLTLHLDHAMDTDEEYTFVIENIYDAAGNEMDRPYVTSFKTSNVQKVIPVETSTGNLLVAEDHTLSSNDIVPYVAPVVPADVTLISTTPTNLSYNITGDSINQTIKFKFSLPLVDDPSYDEDTYKPFFTIERKLIAVTETAWTEYDGSWQVYYDTNTNEVSICDIDGELVQDFDLGDGYEWRITVDKALPFDDDDVTVYLNDNCVLYFMSNLPNMYSTVNSVLMFYPTFEPYDIAREIYLNSQLVGVMNANATAENMNALNYVRYSSLYNVGSLLDTEATRIVLGDLEVEKPDGTLLDRWRTLMEQAENALRRKSPLWAVKGENYPAYTQTTRNWD